MLIVKYYQKVFHLIYNVFSIGSRLDQDDNFGSERVDQVLESSAFVKAD